MRMTEADGRPVLSRTSAERLGKLEHVVIDVPARAIRALHVSGRRKKARLVDWGEIVGFGPDGIVVAGEASLRPPAGEEEMAVVSGRLDLDGRLVLDDEGNAAGPLTDIVFDEGSGAVATLVSGEREIDAARLRAVGPYCVLVRAA
jgi:uncharacterized protein YrrD